MSSILDILQTPSAFPRASVRARSSKLGQPRTEKTVGTIGMLEDDFRQRPDRLLPPLPQIVPTGGRGAAPNFSLSQAPYTVPLPPKKVPVQQPQSFSNMLGGLDAATVSGLGAAGASLLKASGYSAVPRTTGEVLGDAFSAFSAAQQKRAMFDAQQAMKKQIRDEERAFEEKKLQQARDIAEMQYGSVSEKEKRARDLQITRLRKDLRQEFNDTSKPFTEGKKFWVDVVNYSKPEQSSAADLALVFSFMKMLDPESVVREGEQLQGRGLGGLGAEARSLLSKLGISQEGNYEGGLLIIDPAVRQEIRQVAADKFAAISTEQYAREKFTTEEGERAGLTPDFFRSKIGGSGTMQKPYVVASVDELPDNAKSGQYAVIDGVFSQIAVEK